MLNYILDDVMPWHKENYDFSSYLDEKGPKSHAHSSKSDEDITTKYELICHH